MPSRNPPWVEEELILALDLYLRAGLLAKDRPSVIELSRLLNTLAFHPTPPDLKSFRNPSSVACKLANFAAIDPNHPGKGLPNYSKRDVEVWNRYASEEEWLAVIARHIAKKGERPRSHHATPTAVNIIKVDIETHRAEDLMVSISAQEKLVRRREQNLVQNYKDYLAHQGCVVTRHKYVLPQSAGFLYSDLVDETNSILHEAKSDVRRTSVRMAIGQLLDYYRLEDKPSMRLAVLLPRKPSQDLIALIHSVSASVIWKTTDGFDNLPPPTDHHRHAQRL